MKLVEIKIHYVNLKNNFGQLLRGVTLHKYFYEKEVAGVFGVFCIAAGWFLFTGFQGL